MKIHTPILIGAILGVLVLSACAGETAAPSTSITQPQGIQPSSTSTATVNVQPAQQQDIVKPVVTHTEADTAAYNGAMQLNDATYCDKIIDEVYKKECKAALADKLALAEATSQADESLCDKLSTEDKKAACKIQVNVGLDKEKAASEKEKLIQDEASKMQELVEAGDITQCKSLKDSNFAKTCEVNILVRKGYATSDASVCNSASTDEAKIMCQDNMKQALSQ